jgi:ParB-like chromosome segregation protein Spo0J
MSERAPQTHETFEALKPAEHLALPDAEHAEPLRPGEADPRQKLEQARSAAETMAHDENPLEQLNRVQAAETAAQSALNTGRITRADKQQAADRELQRVRRSLNVPARSLSKLIHQPTIRAVSEAAAGTISRPSGLLGGGLTAFLGSSAYLYWAKHVGIRYNYFIWLLLLVGGFMVGLLLEALVWLATRGQRSS